MEEWKEVKLGDICKSNINSYSEKDNWSFVNYLDTGNITENKISDIQFIDLSSESLPSRARRKVQLNDIIYSTVRPNQKHFGIIKNQPENFLVSTGFAVLHINKTIADPNFIFYNLIQNENTESLHAIAEQTTSAYPAIKPSDIENLSIKLPPLPTQQKIAAILSSLDDKIELNNKINTNLEQQAQAIFKNWFVDFEPFGGKMPEGWKVGKLSDIAEIKTDVFSPEKNLDLEVEHYSLPSFDEKHYPVFENSNDLKSNKFIVSKDEVLVSKLNPTVKRVWRPYCISELSISSTEFIVFKPKKLEYRDYLFSIVNSQMFNDFMCSHVTGSTNSHQRTPPKITLDYTLPLDCEDEIKKFSYIVTPMYDIMEKNIIENQKLKTLCDTLLPKLMSGEIEV